MEIVNWARCDMMLIQETLGLRYETRPDQMRHVLAELRRMLRSHPRIDGDTIRVRFSGYGDSTLDVSVRIYALTREWNDYFAIKEDVLLRISDIVEQAGTGFAFPSQTIYMRRDDEMDTEKGQNAMNEVADWRRSGRLPFPRLSPKEVERVDGTLDYPPRGSVEFGSEEEFANVSPEGLSATSQADDEESLEEREKSPLSDPASGET